MAEAHADLRTRIFVQGGHDQTDKPVAASLCFPKRRLRVAVAAIDRLAVTMHAAYGKAGALRKAPDALLPVFTNRVENENAFGPQSHGVGCARKGGGNRGGNPLFRVRDRRQTVPLCVDTPTASLFSS